MTCRPFTADEALSAGFLNRVVPGDQLDDAVATLADTLLAKPSGPLQATKRHVNDVAGTMTGIDRAWADAAALYNARRDPDNRAAADAYLASLKRDRDHST